MKADEKQLLARVLAEEPGAFDEFLERYRALIYSVFYGRGYGFPVDYMDDIYQSFVLALAAREYHKLRAFQGRNNCSLATFLQVVASRFALDELRKWKRHPRGRGASADDDEPLLDVADSPGNNPASLRLDREQADHFHNLLFALEWKRISSVLWVFRGVTRETIAEVMDTSRANIDALYKRAKDQMSRAFAEGNYSKDPREADPRLLSSEVKAVMRRLLAVPPRRVWRGLLIPAAKERAVLGLIMVNYGEFLCSYDEIKRLVGGGDPVAATLSVLEAAALRLDV